MLKKALLLLCCMFTANFAFAEEFLTIYFDDVQISIPRSWRIFDQESVGQIAKQAGATHEQKDRLLVAKSLENQGIVRLMRLPKDPMMPTAIEEFRSLSKDDVSRISRDYAKERVALYSPRVRYVQYYNFTTPKIGAHGYDSILESYDRKSNVDPNAIWHVRMFKIPGKTYDYLMTLSHNKARVDVQNTTNQILKSFEIH